MRLYIIALLMMMPVVGSAGGSIAWDDVSARISKTDPEIITTISKYFTPDRVGGAVRIGYRVDPDHAGERIPPYDFIATRKSDLKRYTLQITESSDFQYSGRYVFTATETTDKK